MFRKICNCPHGSLGMAELGGIDEKFDNPDGVVEVVTLLH